MLLRAGETIKLTKDNSLDYRINRKEKKTQIKNEDLIWIPTLMRSWKITH